MELLGAMAQAKVERNTISYSATISACAKGREWQSAMMLFGAMGQANVERNTITYNAASRAYEEGGA
jgi:pentatricopeptide repeat domain-containing protein 1